MTSSLPIKSRGVKAKFKSFKSRTLATYLRAIGVSVSGIVKPEHIASAHRLFRAARGESVEVNNLWNIIKKHVCPVCDGVKLRAHTLTCSSVCGWKSRRTLMPLSFLLAVLISFDCFAQKGTNIKPVATQSINLIVPKPTRPAFQWSIPPAGASNRVAWGGARFSWTNSVWVTTNLFPVTNGTHYAAYEVLAGVESIPALWPSNRTAQYWLKDMGTNAQGARMITNEILLSTFVNHPADGKHFWQIEDRTVKWE